MAAGTPPPSEHRTLLHGLRHDRHTASLRPDNLGVDTRRSWAEAIISPHRHFFGRKCHPDFSLAQCESLTLWSVECILEKNRGRTRLRGVAIVSDVSQGEGWWRASDGKWYPPDTHPNLVGTPGLD